MVTVNLMAIPDFQTMMRPVLVALDGDQPRSTAQIRDEIAAALNISDEDRLVMLPSGKQKLFTNRVAWAITHMAQAGLLTRPERGRYLLSERGKKVLQEHLHRVDLHVLQQFPEYQDFRSRKSEKQVEKSVSVVSDDVSPSEAVNALVEDSYDTLAAELLDRILAQPPAFLESLSLKLLQAMGYGGRESLVRRGVAVDIGVDVGDTLALIARYSTLDVLCVEPSDYFLAYLRDNVARHFADRATVADCYVTAHEDEPARALFHWGGTATRSTGPTPNTAASSPSGDWSARPGTWRWSRSTPTAPTQRSSTAA